MTGLAQIAAATVFGAAMAYIVVWVAWRSGGNEGDYDEN